LLFTERSLTLTFPFSFSLLVLSFCSTIGAVGGAFFLLNKSSSSSLSEITFGNFFAIVAGGWIGWSSSTDGLGGSSVIECAFGRAPGLWAVGLIFKSP